MHVFGLVSSAVLGAIVGGFAFAFLFMWIMEML